MLMTKSDKELYDKLCKLASRETLIDADLDSEETPPYWSFGNDTGDAYEAGIEDGETHLARALLQEYFGATYRAD